MRYYFSETGRLHLIGNEEKEAGAEGSTSNAGVSAANAGGNANGGDANNAGVSEKGGDANNAGGDANGSGAERNALKKEPMIFSEADLGLTVAMLICGFLYWDFIVAFGAGITAFALILCVITWVYLKKNGMAQTKASLIWLALTVASAFQFILFDNAALESFNFVFISICYIYWVAVSTGRTMTGKLSFYTLWDLINHGISVPFTNFVCEFKGLRQLCSKNKHSRSIFFTLAAIVVFMPLMVYVLAQLSMAEQAFGMLLQKALEMVSVNHVFNWVIEFIFGIPVAAYLFGLLYGNTQKTHTGDITQEKVCRVFKAVSFAPQITVYTVMTIFNCIYVMFFISKGAYFFSAFENILPPSFTYAEYARSGFFELCRVASVNVMLIVVANIFINKNKNGEAEQAENGYGYAPPKMLRFQTAFMAVVTMAMIVTAFRKMYMYIEYYGLTVLRVYTSCFMVVLLLTFGVILIRQAVVFNSARIIIILGVAGFMLLSYGNVDGNIAKYNIERYRNGSLDSLDYNMLMELSDGAAPYLYELYRETDDPEVAVRLYVYLSGAILNFERAESWENGITDENAESWKNVTIDENTEYYYRNTGWKGFDLQSSRADNIAEILRSEGLILPSKV